MLLPIQGSLLPTSRKQAISERDGIEAGAGSDELDGDLLGERQKQGGHSLNRGTR